MLCEMRHVRCVLNTFRLLLLSQSTDYIQPAGLFSVVHFVGVRLIVTFEKNVYVNLY